MTENCLLSCSRTHVVSHSFLLKTNTKIERARNKSTEGDALKTRGCVLKNSYNRGRLMSMNCDGLEGEDANLIGGPHSDPEPKTASEPYCVTIN
jgi:hypothetical protein